MLEINAWLHTDGSLPSRIAEEAAAPDDPASKTAPLSRGRCSRRSAPPLIAYRGGLRRLPRHQWWHPSHQDLPWCASINNQYSVEARAVRAAGGCAGLRRSDRACVIRAGSGEIVVSSGVPSIQRKASQKRGEIAYEPWH